MKTSLSSANILLNHIYNYRDIMEISQAPQTPAVHLSPPTFRDRLARNPVWRFMKARWFHPRTKLYLQAFIDACIIWILGMNLWRFTTLIIAVESFSETGIAMPERAWGWYGFDNYAEILGYAEGSATGMAIGWCFLMALGQWKLTTRQGENGRIQKRIVLAWGMLHIPLWLYVCIAIGLTSGLSMFSNELTHWIALQSKSSGESKSSDEGLDLTVLGYDITWFNVLVIISAMDVAAVVAGAIVRVKYLAPQEEKLVDEEKAMRGNTMDSNTAMSRSV